MRAFGGVVATILFIAGIASGEPDRRIVTLAEATSRALETHETVAAATIERRRAGIASWKAWTTVLPTVEAAGSYTREKDEIAFPEALAAPGGLNRVIVQEEALRGTLSVSQPILAPELPSLVDLGEADRAGADEEIRIARQDFTLAVAEAYYAGLRARSLMEIAEEAVRLGELQKERAETRLAAGETLPSDLLRSETELERARQKVVEASAAAETARFRLARLTGLEGDFELAPALAPRLDLSSADPFVEQALARSPEVLRAEQGLAAARAEERRQRAALFPTLGLQFQYKLVDEEAFAERSDFWELVAGVRVPLVRGGGAQWVAWREQKAKADKIERELQGLRRDAGLGVREAFVAAKTLAAREALAEKEERLAIESHRVLSENYERGRATSVDLLASLNARSTARTDRALLHFERVLALLRLERVTGILGEVP